MKNIIITNTNYCRNGVSGNGYMVVMVAKDIVINGVRCLENTEAMRLQLFFEGKPAREIITLLKSHAFKWSPSNMAWQRQLTNNAIYAFNHWILPVLKGAEVAA